ncbi:reverse transcriptase domain-containing protein [Tanacetum coccineum]|uniref:Reverse transcriptase domain-containing protein n=1 Tax=Tanacetum coccineum TaxID=301880 RepID=A0ABQ5HK31_9ASTR
MDCGSRNGIQTNEKIDRGIAYVNRTKGEKELIIYLAAVKEATGAVLMAKRDGKQIPIYFVSRALQGLEINYTSWKS